MSRKEQIARIAREIQLVESAQQRETSYFEWAISCLELALKGVAEQGDGADTVARGRRMLLQAQAAVPQMRATEDERAVQREKAAAQRLAQLRAEYLRPCARCGGAHAFVAENQDIEMSGRTTYKMSFTVLVCPACGNTSFLTDPTRLSANEFNPVPHPTSPAYR